MAEHPEFTFRRCYTLLAQTPIIHFQPEQPGASLRPSEVKPKLDRYLHRQYGQDFPAGWTLRGRPNALNYQMRIIPLEERKPGMPKIEQCKAYFGNMGDSAFKDLVFRDCRLEINCFIPDLLKFLEENIGSFFVLHNFGTRQSKGFGGFLVEGYHSPQFVHSTVQAHCPHYFYTRLQKPADAQTGLNHAQAIYSILKSGVNMGPDRYIKGYALRPFLPENVGSDKAFLKAKVLPSPILRERESKSDYPAHQFIRALLGLAEYYEFRDDVRNNGFAERRNKRTGQMESKPKAVQIQVAHFHGTQILEGKPHIPLESIENKDSIQRFHSPILIKITQDQIFFLLDDSWQEILGQTFLFAKKWDMNAALALPAEQAKERLEGFHFLQTPEAFDAAGFISGFVAYFNSDTVQTALSAFPERGTGYRPRTGYEMREIAGLHLEIGGIG